MAVETNNKLVKWIEYRLPVFSFYRHFLVDYPAPKNLSYWWNFGSLAGLMLMVQIVTGIVLAMHYTPTASLAFSSVQGIMRDVNYGWLLRYIHATGASMFFVVVYIHLFRGLYYGSYKRPREVLWFMGVIILLLMMATAFFGYTLPWGQMSFWGATVITSLFSAIPVVGHAITSWLWGGYAVGAPTLNRFYALHYLLPFVIVGAVGLHLWALHQHGSNNPLGIDVKGPQDTLPFHPYYTVKDLFGIMVFLIFFSYWVFFDPGALLNPDNSIMANALKTPPHIEPEWYFLPYYAILRSVPNKLIGVCLLGLSVCVLFLLPWLDTSPVRSGKFRPIFRQFFWLFVIDCFVLGYIGHLPPIGPAKFWGRIAATYYFGFFFVILPFVGWFERPKPMPESISQAVLGKKTAKLAATEKA
jgi:ubiquinol-cytochrome c reductase cytochrome b subunit